MRTPVDLVRLEAFCDGTPEGLRAVVDIFLSDTQETLTELEAAMSRGDADAVRLLAHRAGGSCAACGASTLAALLEELESASERPPRDQPAIVRQLASEFEAIARFLRSHSEGRAI